MLFIGRNFLITLAFPCLGIICLGIICLGTITFAQNNAEDCLSNVVVQETIINTIYATYSRKGIEAISPASGEQGVWWSRWSLEIARWIISGGENGNTAPNSVPCNAEAKETDLWQAANTKFLELETKVIEMETAKGLTFMGLQNDKGDIVTNGTGRTVYKDIASGQVYSWQASQKF
jgi:hypothetical protein